MAIHIDELMEYLEKHPVRRWDGNMESLMKMLYDTYSEFNVQDDNEIKALFETFEEQLKIFPKEKGYQLYSTVNGLCREHEVLAFSHGIVVGMHLMTEINRVP